MHFNGKICFKYYFIFTLLVIILTGFQNIFSQVIIKESVKINPDKRVELGKKADGDVELSVLVQSECDNWSAEVIGPCGYGGSYHSVKGELSNFIHIKNPPPGSYKIRLTQFFGESGGSSHIAFIAVYTGIAGYYETADAAQFSAAAGEKTDEFFIKINFPNSFTLNNYSEYVCAGKTAPIPGGYLYCDTTTCNIRNVSNDPASLSISGGNADLVFCYDSIPIGKNIVVDQPGEYSIKLNSPYYGPPYEATIVYSRSGIVINKLLSVVPSSKIYQLVPDENDNEYDPLKNHIVHAFSKKIKIKANANDECSVANPDTSIKYNISITEGARFCSLRDSLSGLSGKSLTGLRHLKGGLIFDLIADGDIPENDERVLIQVSGSSNDIIPCELEYFVHQNKINVSFSPASVKENDTSFIQLKYKNTDGTLIDFDQYEVFDFSLQKGSEYGWLAYKYRNQWWVGDLKNIQGAALPVAFNAAVPFPTEPVESQVLVSAWKDGAQIFGCGSVSIGGTILFVKAEFEKQILSAGDTVGISIKKIDKNGNESDFPANKEFEIGIVQGCSSGNILTQSGGSAKYFSSAKKPLKFVVNSDLSDADSIVVLRIGVPSGKDTTYLPYSQFLLRNKGAKNKEKILKSVKKTEASCSISNFVNEGYGLAEATVGKDDCSGDHDCQDRVAKNVSDFYVECFRNGEGNEYPLKSLGIFAPMQDRFDFSNLFACYNKSSSKITNKWFFKTPNNKIKLKVIKDVRSIEWLRGDNKICITNLEDLKNIDEKEIKYALKDFRKQLSTNWRGEIFDSWPSNDSKFYLITEWLMAHESVHQSDYEKSVLNPAIEKFLDKFISMWNPNCNDFKSIFHSQYDLLLQQGRNQYSGLLNGKVPKDENCLKEILNNKYHDYIKSRYKESGGSRFDNCEKYTQSRVDCIIQKYIDALEAIKKGINN